MPLDGNKCRVVVSPAHPSNGNGTSGDDDLLSAESNVPVVTMSTTVSLVFVEKDMTTVSAENPSTWYEL